MFAPVLITAPAAEFVSLAEAKAHLRVDHTDEDDQIALLIAAAISHLDGWTGVLGRAIVTQTWRQDYTGFKSRMRLPLWPVASVTSVTYRDDAGASQTVSDADYQLLADSLGAYVEIKPGRSWPSHGDHLAPVSVTFVAGEAADNVPVAIKHAALLIIGDLYRNRDTSSGSAAAAVNAFLAPFRRASV